ncbi:hypothetical protein [Candidatus Southlakia epibionticum]|uniref:Uncharacterized protein n=1 Tax=Candidatus Southlakia epibionticum TaxID=3043284 RepID=A0ABY8WXP8_9BACT|nr:hypothetical protein SEML1_0067 [Candidatus Saccharimonadaceae bacterium ML1]
MYSSPENPFSNGNTLGEGDDAYAEAIASTELLSRERQNSLTLDYADVLRQNGTLDHHIEAFAVYIAERETTGESLGFSFGQFVAKDGSIVEVRNDGSRKDEPDGSGWCITRTREGDDGSVRIGVDTVVSKQTNTLLPPPLGPNDVASIETLNCEGGTTYEIISLKDERGFVVTDSSGSLYLPLDTVMSRIDDYKNIDAALSAVCAKPEVSRYAPIGWRHTI